MYGKVLVLGAFFLGPGFLAGEIFKTGGFQEYPKPLVIQRNLFHPQGVSPESSPPSTKKDDEDLSRSRKPPGPGRGRPGDLPSGILPGDRISYEGYIQKDKRFFAMIRVNEEFFVAPSGARLNDYIRVIEISRDRVTLMIGEERETEVSIKESME